MSKPAPSAGLQLRTRTPHEKAIIAVVRFISLISFMKYQTSNQSIRTVQSTARMYTLLRLLYYCEAKAYLKA